MRKENAPTPHITVVQISQTPSERQNSIFQPALSIGESTIVTPAPITRISPISLSEIRDKVNKSPPLQKRQIAQNYAGIFVEWNVSLASATMRDNDTVWLLMSMGGRPPNMISCTVKFSDYKELGIMLEGAPIRVIGRIKEVKDLTVELEEVQLFFIQAVNGVSN